MIEKNRSVMHSKIRLELMIKLTIYNFLKINHLVVRPVVAIFDRYFSIVARYNREDYPLCNSRRLNALSTLMVRHVQVNFLKNRLKDHLVPDRPIHQTLFHLTICLKANRSFYQIWFVWFLRALPRCLGWVINESGTWSSARRDTFLPTQRNTYFSKKKQQHSTKNTYCNIKLNLISPWVFLCMLNITENGNIWLPVNETIYIIWEISTIGKCAFLVKLLLLMVLYVAGTWFSPCLYVSHMPIVLHQVLWCI